GRNVRRRVVGTAALVSCGWIQRESGGEIEVDPPAGDGDAPARRAAEAARHAASPHPSHSASVVIGTSTSTSPKPSIANLRQEISTPIAVSLWCHSRVASDPHGVMIG